MVGTPFSAGDALRRGHRRCARSLPLSTNGDDGGRGGEHHVDLAAEQVGDGRAGAAVRHVRHLDLGQVGEHLAGQVRRGAVALRGIGELAGLGLGRGDDVLATVLYGLSARTTSTFGPRADQR